MAYYDGFDYPSYWIGREYEHQSEVVALREFLKKIPRVTSVAELGAGYGRLTPYYIYRAKRVLISDPSSKLLSKAKQAFTKYARVRFEHSTIEHLRKKVKTVFDLIILVRVAHHLQDIDRGLDVISRSVKGEGYLIMEFPNKIHWKAVITNFLKGNFIYPIDIFPKDRVTHHTEPCIPFLNYHPDTIIAKIQNRGFKVLELRSVSNLRSSLLKRLLPLNLLITLEKHLQVPLAHFYLGPSIFILAQKRG